MSFTTRGQAESLNITPRLVSSLLDEVSLSLRDADKNLYPLPLLNGYYNRAISECYQLMSQIGAEIITDYGTITADPATTTRDQFLPYNFLAFVPGRFFPHSPITEATNFSLGRPLKQVGLFDPLMQGNGLIVQTPTAFALIQPVGDQQMLRFNSCPAAGELFEFQYYTKMPLMDVNMMQQTYTPWYGLLDQLLVRIIEEFCREGLEFISMKREQWRVKTEADIVMLLGLRHLVEDEVGFSMWKGVP